MNPEALPNRTLIAIETILAAGILTLWIPGFQAVGFFQIATFCLALVWVVAIAVKPRPVLFSPVMIPLGAAVIWPLVQLASGHTIYRLEMANSFWFWTVNFICFFLTFQVARDPRRLRVLLKTSLHFAFGLSAVSILQMFTSEGKVFWIFPSGYTDYVLGPFVYRNQYAAFIELFLPVALYFALFSRKNGWVYSLMAGVMASSVIASATRAGTVLVLAEAVAVPLLAMRAAVIRPETLRAALPKTAAFTFVAVVIVGWGAAWQRLWNSDPYFLRREVYISAARMFRDRPLMGFGLGTWPQAYPGYAIFDPGAAINQAHNDWLQWAVEGGIPFLACMLCAAGLLLEPALRSLWGLGVLFVLLHCMVDYPLQQRPAFAALFFAFAAALAAARVERPRVD